jgi:hypothetical protein
MAPLSILMALLLLSCSQVPIKDEIFYGNKGMRGAVEFHTFTTDQKQISFEDWMKMLRSEPLVCSSVSTFGDYKKAIEQLCSVCNCCSPDVTAKAEEFFNNIQKATK